MKRLGEMVRPLRPRMSALRRNAAGRKVLIAGSHPQARENAALKKAEQAGLPLYHVDVSALTDKYIGETEKNLRRVLAMAGRLGAMLFFDEADAIFGKRAHVVDRLDRHASVDVPAMLRQIEEHRGTILVGTDSEATFREDVLHLFTERLRLAEGDGTPETELIPVSWTVTPEALKLCTGFIGSREVPFGSPAAQCTMTLNLVWEALRETFGPSALPGMQLDVRFTAPLPMGQQVTATGRPQEGSPTLYDVTVTAEDGTKLLSGTATIAGLAALPR